MAPVAGAMLGAVARWWMRLISDDPEFSWSGTIFIVGAFTVMGFGHGLARVLRPRTGRRPSLVVRFVGGLLTMPIFVGAGGVMLPTVVGGSLARWRTSWPTWARVGAGLVALPIPAVIAFDLLSDGVAVREAAGLVLLAATYWAVIASLGPVAAPDPDGRRMRRWLRWTLIGFALVAPGILAAAAFGLPGAG